MDAYRAFAAAAEMQRRIEPPPPPASISSDTPIKRIAAADPQWRDLTTGAILSDADAVQKLIDLTAQHAGGDAPAIVPLTRQQLEMRIRRSEAHAGWLSVIYSAPEDPNRDLADFQIEVDRSLAALLRAMSQDLAAMAGDTSATVDREALASEMRSHAANAERCLTLLARHTDATVENLRSHQFVGQERRVEQVRASMAAFRTAAASLASVTPELRQMAQTIEAPDTTSSDWFEHGKTIAGIMERTIEPLEPFTAFAGG